MATLSITELEKAHTSLKEALFTHHAQMQGQLKDMLRDSVIQRFEFCIELAYKVSLKTLGIPAQAPKPALREMLRSGLIDNLDLWFDFIEARNKSSHTYDEAIANEVMTWIEKFEPEFGILIQRIKLK